MARKRKISWTRFGDYLFREGADRDVWILRGRGYKTKIRIVSGRHRLYYYHPKGRAPRLKDGFL